MTAAASDNADALYRQAQAACRQGRFGDGIDLAHRALALDPGRARIQVLLGMALVQVGRLQEALASFDSAITSQPDLADAHGNRADVLVAMGRPQEAVESYGRAIALLPDAVENWLNRAATLVELGRHGEALADYDRAVALAPDLTEAHFTRGIVLRQLGREAEAVAAFERTVALDPQHFAALINRGSALFKLDKFEQALASFESALRLNPDDVDALYNVGFMLGVLHRHAEALATYDRLLAIAPDHIDALLNRGIELQHLRRTREAIASYAKIVAIEPEHVTAHLNEAFAWLALGDFRDGWPAFEWRLRKPGFEERSYAPPAWRGRESVAGRTVLLYAEQGLGDSINMARYVPLLAGQGARIILEVQPPLKPLLAGLDGATAVVARGEPLPAFDCHCPLMSLPLAFGTEPATIPAGVPYLVAAPERVAAWAARLPASGRLRVGVNWCGNPAFADDRNRSMTLPTVAPLLALPGIDFVSLNPGVRDDEATELAAMPNVAHIAPEFRDLADTAAVMAGLDLIVTTDTAIAHLAGALGRPVWIMVSSLPDWRWAGDGEVTPWYPTSRLFRQPAPGDWAGLVARVGAELIALASRRGR